jgi:hypothetical protein
MQRKPARWETQAATILAMSPVHDDDKSHIIHEAEASYQCVMLAKQHNRLTTRLFTMRDAGLPWVECLAMLRADLAEMQCANRKT